VTRSPLHKVDVPGIQEIWFGKENWMTTL